MNQDQQQEIKTRLLKEIEEINSRVKELKEDDPFSDPDYANNNAAIDNDVREQEAHQRIEAEVEELKERLENIHVAIKRIDKGQYGHCKRCNKVIPDKRLELIPETIYCVNCESELKR